MPGALGTIRAVLRLPSLRRLIPAFLAFSVAEWASWIGIVVYAYSRGGPAEAGIVAGVVFIPSIIVAPAASTFGDRRPRTQVLTAAYAILALSMAATAVALAVCSPIRGVHHGDRRRDERHARPPGPRRAAPRGRADAGRAGGRERGLGNGGRASVRSSARSLPGC